MPRAVLEMPTIKIDNVTSREAALPLVRALQGKSFMKLEVGLAPARGSFDVLVTTNRADTSEEELREMVMLLMCQVVRDMGSAPVLRALAEGCDRLNDGDLEDRRAADAADGRALTSYGLVRERTAHVPREEARSGYVRVGGEACYAWEAGVDCGYAPRPPVGSGWLYTAFGDTLPVPPGSNVYADEACSVLLRTV